MKISRLIYGILVAVLSWSYFQPWTVVGGQSFPGWATVLPFSFFYFIGLAVAVIILFTGFRAVGLSILAGVLMFGSNLLAGIVLGLIASLSHGQLGSGFAYAFFFSLVYLILGPICGSQFDKTSHVKIQGEGVMSKIFWTVIIGIPVSIIATLILKYAFNIG